jgi:GDP/UDP-N,N'-diacetylbacillosamine 2-epimerase (hydrolysing)
MTLKVCIVTGTRADFGLLRWLMADVRDSELLQLQVVATGAHLSTAHGNTLRDIADAGFEVDATIDLALGDDSARGIARAMGRGVAGFGDAFDLVAPDIVVVLGDRYEVLAAASAAAIARIPLLHLHGGEITEGAVDDAIRHAVTKLAHLHGVATDEAARRVLQMGEAPDRVHLVGGLGVDALARTPLMSREALETEFGWRFAERNLLVTFHPVTLKDDGGQAQMLALLDALSTLSGTRLIFTLPNADAGNRALAEMVKTFVEAHPMASAHASLGQVRYLSCMRLVDGVVGNSSSGLLEAPSLRVGTIDIGDRQRGRPRASSVLHCEPDSPKITRALSTLYSTAFRAALANTVNPYGNGGAIKRIVRLLESTDPRKLVAKRFSDLDCAPRAKEPA